MNKDDLYYQTHIFCCNNQRPAGHPRGCCKDKGADDLRNYLKVRMKEAGVKDARVNAAGCLDRCELGPVLVIYPEGIWYTFHTRADVDEIVDSHFGQGRPVARLLLDKNQKELRDDQKNGGAETAVC